MGSLTNKTASGVKWQAINVIVQKGMSIVTFAILARLLTPNAFGLFAMAFVVLDGFGLFESMGLDAGLIRTKDVKEEECHTAFVMSLMAGCALCVITLIAAPFMATFFDMPRLANVLRALAFMFILSSVSKVPKALLHRGLDFKSSVFSRIGGNIINAVVVVVVAYFTRNVWALVIAHFFKQMFMTVLLFYFSGYRPKFVWNKEAADQLFNFGKFIVAVAVISYIGANINRMYVGRVLGAAALGYYAVANNLGNFLNANFMNQIYTVTFPAFASIQDDHERLKRGFLKGLRYISLIAIPFGLTLIFMAENIVLVLFGDKWLPVIPLIRLFGIMQILAPLMGTFGGIYMAKGQSNYLFMLTLATISIKFPLYFLLSPKFGLEGVVMAEILAFLIMVPVRVYLIKRLIGVKLTEFLGSTSINLLSGVIMALAYLLMQSSPLGMIMVFGNSLPLIQLCVWGGIGCFAYLLSVFIFDRSTFIDLSNIVKGRK